mmetsp:Transcript_37996/g.104475  ORF Transcript_37996/g.104475 Transcript_37996/m.104475 type:complete len:200 (+) Transcript_37996:586-1185(+)
MPAGIIRASRTAIGATACRCGGVGAEVEHATAASSWAAGEVKPNDGEALDVDRTDRNASSSCNDPEELQLMRPVSVVCDAPELPLVRERSQLSTSFESEALERPSTALPMLPPIACNPPDCAPATSASRSGMGVVPALTMSNASRLEGVKNSMPLPVDDTPRRASPNKLHEDKPSGSGGTQVESSEPSAPWTGGSPNGL